MKNKKYMKRTITLGLAAAAAAGCLSGCGKGKTEATDAGGKYNLRAMTYDYFGNPMKGEVGAEIEKKVEDYTNVNLDVMWTPKDNYDDKLNLVLAGGGMTCLRYLPQRQNPRLLSMRRKQGHYGILSPCFRNSLT